MTLKQLRYLCEIVRHELHLSRAAEALHTSQPGVSKQVQILERELGVVIFDRKRNRLLGLTPAGRDIYRFAERALVEAENVRSVGREFRNELTGELVIATTHTQARYALPPVIRRFRRAFPRIRLEFWQGNRQEVFRRVESDQADLAIGTDCGIHLDGVSLLPFGSLHHSVVTRPGHELMKSRPLTLERIARYPLITHAFDQDGRWKLAKFFEAKGLRPNIVFRAVDTDVCKAYVELDMGIAILASIAYDKARDKYLRAADADHLFEPETLYVGLNRRRYHRHYVFEFIENLAPSLTRVKVEQAIG
jgi:LysR family transcriptional regulator, cys regulon transcriptional activator